MWPLAAALLLPIAVGGRGQTPHRWRTDQVQQLDTVVITATRRADKPTIPAQRLQGAELERLSAHSVADALRYFSGVQIKDYGGIGGLKTVNIRSLGTNHTGVFYDGVEIGNAQNGTVDLGRFALDAMEAVSIYNGQKTDGLQTAKDYGSASAVYMQTREPQFAPGRRQNIKVGMAYGSFDTYNPTLLYERRISPTLSASLSAEYVNTTGRYKFRYAKRHGYDTTEVRRNGDVEAIRVQASLFGQTAACSWRATGYIYDSRRGYPGAAVRESPGVFTHQDRQWDTSAFAQGSLRLRATDRYTLQLKAKLAYDRLHYLSDPRRDVSTMYADNRYRQTEAYLSASHFVELNSWWTVSAATDLQYNYLDAEMDNRVYPSRWQLLCALASTATLGPLTAQASLYETLTSDRLGGFSTPETDGGGTRNKATAPMPTVALAYQTGGLALRAFCKRSMRLPTFNDLFYTVTAAGKALKPEHTTQWDLGLTYTVGGNGAPSSSGPTLVIQADGYFNRVTDKIVAMPTSNQFRWTILNYGLCHIWGLDASASLAFTLGPVRLTTRAAYTYNRAKDRTDPNSEFYNGQLPYIPWHSGSAIVQAEWGRWSANYSFIYTGERYEASANTKENYQKPWYTSDLGLSYEVGKRRAAGQRPPLKITCEVNNLFNQQYEVVQCYPMPGTNFKLKAAFFIN